ncbi:CbrC family protein [Streptomyces sp. NRRL B-1347]|uniref:CbrC family protein n=1 Tax=Streptomyces sp. NRRL B-1347 TaxID=1476877 RepID=UPI00099B3363|nr:CbrC family protein [Streptomyces sp. NRRL B-1347]
MDGGRRPRRLRVGIEAPGGARESNGWGWPSEQVEHFLGSLDKDGEATAYLFRCRVCAAHLAYADFA